MPRDRKELQVILDLLVLLVPLALSGLLVLLVQMEQRDLQVPQDQSVPLDQLVQQVRLERQAQEQMPSP